MKRSPLKRTGFLTRSPMKRSLKPIALRSKKRARYLRSTAHKQAVALITQRCLPKEHGAPGRCIWPVTAHHVFARSAAGSLPNAEQWPVIPAYSYHNDAIEHVLRRWAEHTEFEWEGERYPFRLSEKTARAWLEARSAA